VTGRLLPCGEHAVLVEVDSLAQVLALHERLWVRHRPPGLLEAVVGARTLLLVVAGPGELASVRSAVERLLAEASGPSPPTGATRADPTDPTDPSDPADPADLDLDPDHDVVEIRVSYDGPDLDEVAERTGLSPEQVVAAHTGRLWLVGFAGFAPGFAYLVDGDPRLNVPRRTTPRTRVPAGSVGLAGEFSGVYPRASPGGWQLIGHTDEPLWDLDRDPPALLRPGLRVRFLDAGGDR
jgi:KipI family sensor histidine kinase inhibitor